MQKTIITGNLTADPRLNDAHGTAVANFTVAVNDRWGSGDESQERTTWFNIAAWGKLGEACAAHLKKGRRVLVDGKLVSDPDTGNPRVFERASGEPGAAFELRAEFVEFL